MSIASALDCARAANDPEQQIERHERNRTDKSSDLFSPQPAVPQLVRPSLTLQPVANFLNGISATDSSDPYAWQPSLEISLAGGYDSNPDQDHVEHGSAVAVTEVTFKAIKPFSDNDKLTLQLDGTGTLYEGDFISSDDFENIFSAKFEHKADSFKFALEAKDDLDYTSGRLQSNEFTFTPGAEYWWNKSTGTGISYGFSHIEYYIHPEDAAHDSTANTHRVDLYQTVNLNCIKAQWFTDDTVLTLRFFRLWNQAEGNLFDYEGNSLQLKLVALKLTEQVTMDVTYTHAWRTYRQVTGPRRRDERDSLEVEWDYDLTKLLPALSKSSPYVFLRYDLLNNTSTTQGSFMEHTIILGFDISTP